MESINECSPILSQEGYDMPIAYGFLTDRSRIIIGDRTDVRKGECTLTETKNKMTKLKFTSYKLADKKDVERREQSTKGIKLFCKGKWN